MYVIKKSKSAANAPIVATGITYRVVCQHPNIKNQPQGECRMRVKKLICDIIRDDGQRSLANRIFNNGIIALIVINIALVILELVLELPDNVAVVFNYVEIVAVLVFSLEYVLRLWTADLIYSKIRADVAGGHRCNSAVLHRTFRFCFPDKYDNYPRAASDSLNARFKTQPLFRGQSFRGYSRVHKRSDYHYG
jgi:hypothetical protein